MAAETMPINVDDNVFPRVAKESKFDELKKKIKKLSSLVSPLSSGEGPDHLKQFNQWNQNYICWCCPCSLGIHAQQQQAQQGTWKASLNNSIKCCPHPTAIARAQVRQAKTIGNNVQIMC